MGIFCPVLAACIWPQNERFVIFPVDAVLSYRVEMRKSDIFPGYKYATLSMEFMELAMPNASKKKSAKDTSRRRLVLERLESRALMAVDGFIEARHNWLNPSDVNMDGFASPIDALAVINELNRSDRGVDSSMSMMADTNNDGSVSPIDALVVIDTINEGFIAYMPSLFPRGGSGEDTQSEVTAVDDGELVYVASDAAEKPQIEIDVLKNDIGEGLRIVDLGMPGTGTVAVRASTSDPDKMVVVYTPNESSANYDRFLYMIESSDGRRSTAFAAIKYEVQVDESVRFELRMPEIVEGSAGQELNFRGADFSPLIQIDYAGFAGAKAGVYLSWEFTEGFSVGQRFVGELLSRNSSELGVYPASNGLWMFGDIADVNRILANLYFKPADGYSSQTGIRLIGSAFLYSSIGVNYGSVHTSTLLKTTKQPSAVDPVALDDYFASVSRTTPVLLDVLSNDDLKAFAANPGEITVEITPWAYSDATVEWDPVTRKIVYTPGFLGAYNVRHADQFAYTLRTPDGKASQAVVTVVHQDAV